MASQSLQAGAAVPARPQRKGLLTRLGRATLKGRVPNLAQDWWRWTIAVLELVNKELQFSRVGSLPFRTRVRLWRRGMLSVSSILYRLDDPDRAPLYLSDYQRHVGTWGLNRPFEFILNNKLAFWGFMRNFSPAIAPLAGLLEDGRLQLFGRRPAGGLESLGQAGAKLMLKPLSASGGSGVVVYEFVEGVHRLNYEPCTVDELGRVLGRGSFLVCPYLEQAEYARRIFPGVANTIRLLTLYDDERQEAFIAAGVHRFGTRSGSKLIDAWARGGLAADIDLATGRLGTAYGAPRLGELPRWTHHPDTNEAIEGAYVANWVQISQGIVALASQLPFLPYVGWDILATDDGFRIIEGNNRSDVNFLQLWRPLLANPRTEKFFRRRGLCGSESARTA